MTPASDRQRWVDSPAQTVFDDMNMKVMFKPGGSDILLLTFGNADTLANGTRFFADTLVGKYGINCLGFMAHAANWFPASSMRAAVRELAFTLAAFDIRLAYGSSLGAYAAIKHSALLGATHVVAYCPQWSIDPVECGAQDSGFRNLYRPEMAGMGIHETDMAGQITIFYDPGAPSDSYHYNTIRNIAARNSRCRVQACHVHHVGHHVAPALAGSALTTALFAACFHGQTASLYTLINPTRRASVQRRRNLLFASVERHPVLALGAFRFLARAGQAGIMDGSDCLARLHRALRMSLRPELADELVATVLPHVSALRAALLQAGAVPDRKDPDILLETVHRSVLCYCAMGRCLVHVDWPPGENATPGRCAVQTDEAGRLCLTSGGEAFVCRSLDHEVVEVTPVLPGETPACFEARSAGSFGIFLMACDHYLTALPDGTVYRIEREASKWEVFVPVDRLSRQSLQAASAHPEARIAQHEENDGCPRRLLSPGRASLSDG